MMGYVTLAQDELVQLCKTVKLGLHEKIDQNNMSLPSESCTVQPSRTYRGTVRYAQAVRVVKALEGLKHGAI